MGTQLNASYIRYKARNENEKREQRKRYKAWVCNEINENISSCIAHRAQLNGRCPFVNTKHEILVRD